MSTVFLYLIYFEKSLNENNCFKWIRKIDKSFVKYTLINQQQRYEVVFIFNNAMFVIKFSFELFTFALNNLKLNYLYNEFKMI